MKAAVIEEKNVICIKDVEQPCVQEPYQVLVKVKMVGICGSDVHIFKGENPFATYPRVFGHEFTGEIIETGAAVTKVKPGDHIVGEPIVSCGACYACRKGRKNVCENLKVMGVHIDGGCSQFLVLPEDKVHKIDSRVPWKCAVLTEPMTIGLQATSRGDVQKNDVVLIMGGGTIGLCNLLAAKEKGAVCIVTDIVTEKLDYAKKLGADYVIDVSKENLEDRLRDITGSMGPNVVIDCVCIKSSLEQAVKIVSAAGRVVELGFGPITSEIPHMELMKKEVGLMGTRLQSGKFPAAVTLVENHTELLADFVTQIYPAVRVKEAFEYAIEHPEKVRKTVVEF